LIGSGEIRLKRPENLKHAVGYIYRVRNRQALNLLTQISLYLRTYNKRKRAEMVLKNYIKLTPRNGKYSTEILTQRKKFIKDFFAISGSRKTTLKLC